MLELPSLGHEAFFIDERLSLPKPFFGTVEVTADQQVFLLALKLDNGQLSVVKTDPVKPQYRLQVFLDDGRQLEANMFLLISDGMSSGLADFTGLRLSLLNSNTIRIVSGFGYEGIMDAFIKLTIPGLFSFSNPESGVLELFSEAARTSANTISGSAFWFTYSGSGVVRGSFRATRR